jgi:hypothetical protein
VTDDPIAAALTELHAETGLDAGILNTRSRHSGLPAARRRLMALAVANGAKPAEVAERLEVTPSTVYRAVKENE